MQNIKKAVELAKDWDLDNPAMGVIPVPNGYKAKYVYKQPVACFENQEHILVEDIGDGLGIVTIEAGHELKEKEKDAYRKALEDEGMVCIESMRLVKQAFSYSI